ncbi:MAG: DUF222 domain-containing protein [Actinomycetota bacterium]|nr:DUF222 domain-containing protein [Actinomycetota bacterium]
MASQVLEASRGLRALLADFDATLVPGPDCALVAEELAITEKACSGSRLLAAARAVECGAHKEAGAADPVSWLSRQGGTTGRDARKGLELAKVLDAHPATKDALVSGSVSVSQAHEIAAIAAELPEAEHDLLETARHGDLTKVRDEARERRLSSTPVRDLHRAQLARRRFRHWRDGLGMVCFEGALPPETGVPFVARIERDAARRHRDAKRTGDPERFEAYAADALVALTASDGSGKRGPQADLVIVCDLYAWRRGYALGGETCHVIGGGPIPVEVAKELSRDAFLKGVLHDGVSIHKIRHYGRKYTAELRTALDLGPVPAFSGRACANCARPFGLQRDHRVPVASSGPTTYDNVQDLCYSCHAAKTERDRAAGLLGKTAKARGPTPPAKARGPGLPASDSHGPVPPGRPGAARARP